VSDRYDFFCAEGGLEAAKGAAGVLDSLYYTVEVLEVLPDKASDAWVFWYALFGAVRKEVFSRRTTDRNVINVGDGGIGNLGL
jgi:hypothetical protein